MIIIATGLNDEFVFQVAVGCGSQIGRMLGGFLLDFGGFAFCFLIIGGLQIAYGALGFTLSESISDEESDAEEQVITQSV